MLRGNPGGHRPVAEKEGAYVVDNSSYWRMDPTCALVVPEINLADIHSMRRLVANPNCSTIQSVLPLKPLSDKFGLVRVNYATYQAVSGSGKRGLNDWESAEKGDPCKFYPYDISHTCIPEIDVFFDDGYSKEEMKMVNETRKILHLPNLPVSATCIRVPVPVAHGVLIKVEFSFNYTLKNFFISKSINIFQYHHNNSHTFHFNIIISNSSKNR